MYQKLCFAVCCYFWAAVAFAQEPPAMKGMTERHNYWRSQLGIPPLAWSPELATYAQKWATELARKGCKLSHSGGKFGENIYWCSGIAATPQQVVDAWANERKSFDHNTQQCKGSWEECGHYTQVIWATTTLVGCAMVKCSNGAEIWVCSYSPAGNMQGEKPYKK